MKKLITIGVCLLFAIAVRAAEKVQHRVKVTQVNEWQAIVSCRNGRTPTVYPKAIDGVIIVACEGRDE